MLHVRPMESLFADIGTWLRGIGAWAYLAAPAVMALVAIFPVPAEAPAMVNGALFGPVVGSFLTWLGAMVGAQASFELSRLLGRPAAERLLGARNLDKADTLVNRAGWGGLLVARFIPLIAFTVLNWGAGLTSVSRWRFVWTTAVGILPGAIVFTVTGTSLYTFARRFPSLAGWLAAVTVVVGLAWLVRRRQRPAAR